MKKFIGTNLKAPLILIIYFFIQQSIFSQNVSPSGPNAQNNLQALGAGSNSNAVLTFHDWYQGLKGNPYLYPEWRDAIIELHDGKITQTSVKMDLYSDEVRAKLTNGDSIIVNAGLIKSFTVPDTLGRSRKFIYLLEKNDLGYFEELYRGEKFVLICKRRKKIKKATKPGSYNHGNLYDEFIMMKPKYYLLQKNGRLNSLKLTQNGLVRDLGSDVKTILKKYDLKPNQEADLIHIVKKVDGTFE